MSETKVTKRGAAKVFREAAKILDKHGWCQGQMKNRAGCFCGVGAVRQALNKHINWDCNVVVYQEHMDKEVGLRWFTSWNDVPYRTKDEVTAKLRKMARDLEHGGKL